MTAARFTSVGPLMVRAVQHPDVPVPPWPDLTATDTAGISSWRAWTQAVWSFPAVRDAVRHASSDLGRELDVLMRQEQTDTPSLRKLTMALASYVLRMKGRPVPFGLFAGIAEGAFGERTEVRWGSGHRTVARAGSGWLATVIAHLEGMAQLREHLPLVTNNTAVVRGARLVVPWQPRPLAAATTAVQEASVPHTPEIRAVMHLAGQAVTTEQILRELPSVDRAVVDDLIRHRFLISALHPPATVPDALGHVLGVLDRCGATRVPEAAEALLQLREIHRLLASHSATPPARADEHRTELRSRMAALAPQEDAPLAVDVHLDGDVTLARAVAWEAEQAAGVLARVSPEPYGTRAWTEYRIGFAERYGPGVMVPLVDLVNPATGLGLPDDFHGSLRIHRPVLNRRDGVLLARAQQSVQEGAELVLDEGLVKAIAVGDAERAVPPPDLEVLGEVHARSAAAVDAGDFQLVVRGVSRGWGYFTGGRFAALLAEAPQSSALLGALARRPVSTAEALAVQLSFPALPPKADHITRAPRLHPDLLPLAEHHGGDLENEATLDLADLAVMLDRGRLHLVSRSRRRAIEPRTPHPLQIECQTPTLARFLDELVRGQSVRMTGPRGTLRPFDWGAAHRLAALPRLRYGRTILSPASWRLDTVVLPGHDADDGQWQDVFNHWRTAWRVPRHVQMENYDLRLGLDLDHPGHLALLRHHLDRPHFGSLVLVEAGNPDSVFGWNMGRSAEVVVLLRAATTPRPAPVQRSAAPWPEPRAARLGDLPGPSPYLRFQLYAPPQAHRDLVVEHLPHLFAQFNDQTATWWFEAHQGPGQPHVEVVLRLLDPHLTGAGIVRANAVLHRFALAGLIADTALVPYRPHTGRWGTGPVLRAAESVFAADAAVIAAQWEHLPDVDPRALAAVNTLAFATAFHPTPDQGFEWILARPKEALHGALPASARQEALRLGVPGTREHENALPDPAVAAAWTIRRHALTTYRALVDAGSGVAPDFVLEELMAAHIKRATGSADAAVVHRLARAAAAAHRARRDQEH